MDMTPTCTAKSKQSGQRCRNFATKGKAVCRIHGGKSTGVKTAQGLLKIKKAKTTHGLRSAEAMREAREVRDLIKQAKQLLAGV